MMLSKVLAYQIKMKITIKSLKNIWKTSFKKKSFRQEQGFTLIEVLVSVALIGVLVTMATTIFINTVRNAKKADIVNEARQNASLVIDQLQRDVRTSSSPASINATGTSMTVNGIVWLCVAEVPGTTNGYITRDAGTAVTITNKDKVSGVSVNSCNFTPLLSSTELVTFNFTINEGVSVHNASQEYTVSLPFTTSVARRGF